MATIGTPPKLRNMLANYSEWMKAISDFAVWHPWLFGFLCVLCTTGPLYYFERREQRRRRRR